ncbi:MAG: hypothetical protein Q4G68_00890 [Planctomycetia bacterium]|nr:hypothetical protein [Planctomycetia bacterium]
MLRLEFYGCLLGQNRSRMQCGSQKGVRLDGKGFFLPISLILWTIYE